MKTNKTRRMLTLGCLFILMTLLMPSITLARIEGPSEAHSPVAPPEAVTPDMHWPALSPKFTTSATADAENVELVGQIGGTTDAVAVQGEYAYIGEGPRLTILDVSDPTAPSVVGKTAPRLGFVADIAVDSNHAYVAALNGGLRIVDVSDPAQPTEIGVYDTPEFALGVFVSDSTAYVAAWDGLRVVDVSDPTHPTEIGFYDTPGGASGVFVSSSTAYVADQDGGLRVVDVSDPTHPTEVGFDDTLYAWNVFVSDSIAYVASGGNLIVVDVSNPAQPTEIGVYDTPSSAFNVFVSDSTAYVAAWDGLRVVDVSDPTHPTEIGFYDTPGGASGVFVSSSTAYVTDSDGVRVVDVSDPTHPTEISVYDTPGPLSAEDVFVSDSTAYVADNDGGLRVVDVSDPAQPTEIGYQNTPGYAQGVFVNGSTAYVVGDTGSPDHDGWLRVVDVSNPAQPTEIGYQNTPGYAQGVFVNGSTAYVVGDTGSPDYDGWLRVVDVSNPAQPTEVGVYDTPEGARDVFVSDCTAYVASGVNLLVVDVSNPAQPTEVGFYGMGGSVYGVFVSGSTAYVAAGGNLIVVDVSNPAHPTEVSFYGMRHAQDVFVSGSAAYVATEDGGLWVVDVSDPAHPTEVGYYYNTPRESNMYVIRESNVFVSGSTAYVADNDGGLIILRYTGPIPNSGLRIITTEPTDNAIGVPTSTSEITVQFNKPVYAPSLNDLTMGVGDGESRVSGAVEYRPDNNVAVFKPDELAPGTQYLVMLTSDIVAADDPEQHLETYSWLFTTVGSERDNLIEALRALQTALTDKIAYDAQIVSIDFTLARELHKQKALLDFLRLSSEVFLLWTGRDADALFGHISEFTDIVGKVSLAIETAGLIEDAQAMEARLRDIVKIADQDYGGCPLVGEEFDTSGYQNYFRNAIMGSQSPVKSIPLLWGPVGYTPSEVNATNLGPSGVQSEITLQFDTLIEELPDPLPIGLEVDELTADIKKVTRSVRRSQHREEEISYSAYFPGYWEPFPQCLWLGAVAEDSKMTSRLASDAANKVKEEAQLTVNKTAMAGTKLVLVVTSGGATTAAEAVYQVIDVAMLPSDIKSVSDSFEADPYTLLDQHVYRMVFDYGIETAMVWRIANEVASSVDHRVHYAYAQTTRGASIESAVVISNLELQDIELTDSDIGEGTGVITISNSFSAPIRTRLTGYIDTAVTGSTETPIIGVFSSDSPHDIAPGATKALTFTYTAFSNSHFGVQGYGAKALLHLINLDTLKQSTYGPIEGRFFAGASRELDVMNNQNVHVAMTGTLSLGQVQTQTVTLGSVQTQTVILQPATQRVRFQLTQDFHSDFDLHLYDELGRHVGFDYTNATVEVNIPNSAYSGRDARTEWIQIDPITSSRQFVIKVVAMDSDSAADFSVIAIETPEIPAVVKIFPENLMRETKAPTSTVRLAIREIGGQSEFTQITLLASDLKSDSGDTIPAANLDFTPPTTTVIAGGELYVTGTITLPDNLTKTTYTGTLTVEGQDAFTNTPITKTMGITLVLVNPQQIYLPIILRE